MANLVSLLFPHSTIFTNPMAPWSAMPTAPPSTDAPFPDAEYVPIFANGTRRDCITYAVAPVLIDAYNRTFSYLCEDAAKQYGVSVADLKSWNGEAIVTDDIGSGSQCFLASARQVCMRMLPYTRSPGITSYCVNYQAAPPGYDCAYFGWRWGANVTSLVEWNPAMNCTGVNSLQKGKPLSFLLCLIAWRQFETNHSHEGKAVVLTRSRVSRYRILRRGSAL